jgi:hypothetical protein
MTPLLRAKSSNATVARLPTIPPPERQPSMIVIDLNARILPDEHNVFVVRPGSNFGLFPEITQLATLVLELPGLDLTTGKRPEDNDLRQRVNRSRALRAWYNGTHDQDSKPDLNLQKYSATDGGASAAQFVGLVRTFFERMKPGDLVIVPPKSYMDDAWIGEIKSASYEIEPAKVARMFGDEILPGRAVRWIAKLPKRDLPYAILDVSWSRLSEQNLRVDKWSLCRV